MKYDGWSLMLILFQLKYYNIMYSFVMDGKRDIVSYWTNLVEFLKYIYVILEQL